MGLNDVFAKTRGLDAGERELLIATLPLRGGDSGTSGTAGIVLTGNYLPPSTSDGHIKRVFCNGSAGNVKFDLADGTTHVLPVAAQDWLMPAPAMITKIYETGTTATTLHVFW